MEQMLSVNSGLYGEVFYLKKAMDTIEGITANSYELYRDLREQDMNEYSQRTLGIAQQIHEVKKDSQRILAGLLKLYDNEKTVNMSLSEVLNFAGKANRKYSEMLHKQVKIEIEQQYEGESPYYIPLLTVLNNLLANAVEAIEQEGLIRVQVFEQGKEVHFVVTDSGKGIPEAKRGVILSPVIRPSLMKLALLLQVLASRMYVISFNLWKDAFRWSRLQLGRGLHSAL